MKKSIIGFLLKLTVLLMVLTVFFPRFASAGVINGVLNATPSIDLPVARSTASPQNTSAQGDVPLQYFDTLNFAGCAEFRAELTTTPVQIMTGGGLLYELHTSSGSLLQGASSYALAFDSASISGLGLVNSLGTVLTAIPKGVALTPKIFTPAAGNGQPTFATGNTVGTYTLNSGEGPVYYANGLVISNSDPGLMTGGCYRTIAGNNPPP